MAKISKNKRKNNGFSLLELLFYLSFFAVLSIVVINAMIIMSRSFRETTLNAEFLQSSSILEKISRDIRQAEDFSYVSNVLTINTKDDSNNPKTITYTFSGSNIQIVDSVLGNLGNLNTPNIVVTNLNFTQIITNKSKAVKILLTVESTDDALNRTANFYDTVVLRGSY